MDPKERGGRARWLAIAASLSLASCSGSPAEGGLTARGQHVPTPSVAALRRAGAVAIGAPEEHHLPFEVMPLRGDRAAFLVSDAGEEPVAFARRFAEDGALGPVLALPGEHVFGAFGFGDETTLVTSNGSRLCVATYPKGQAEPRARGCREVAPVAVAPFGDKLALIEIDLDRPADSLPPVSASPPRPTHHAHVVKDAGKKAKAHGPSKRAAKANVIVKIRFVSREGEFDAEAQLTGLSFKQPQEGLRVVDAHARAGGVDLFWFEWAPERSARSALGGARLMVGFIKPDGTLDKSTRTAVTDGDLEYGFVRERKAARLLTTDAGSAIVALDNELECNAWRAAPKVFRLAQNPLVCSIEPERFTLPLAPSQAELDALLRISQVGPRRAFGQAKTDPGLVVWAGDRAVFLRGASLASASREHGDVREEQHPFIAHRTHLAWGAIAEDGESVALAGADIVHVDPHGGVETAHVPPDLPRVGALAVNERPFDRAQAQRIGRSWFVTRGAGFRVFPTVAPAPLQKTSADVADASVLVGGVDRGLAIEVGGDGGLTARAIDAAGSVVAGDEVPAVASPVRPGFDAVPRRGGGAIVAGMGTGDPSHAVAVALGRDGRAGPAFATPLTVHPGDFAVRLMALPQGGALLTDLQRTEVVWLDDDGKPVARAPWPNEHADSACREGRPAPAFVPSPAPARFVRVPELGAAGTCVVGEPTWTTDGLLLWFAVHENGLDASAELGVARPSIEPADLSTATAPASPLPPPSIAPPPRHACPLDMVLVAKHFCIDRFEDSLVDASTFEPLSPDYVPVTSLEEIALGEWAMSRSRTGDVHAKAMPLPTPPSLRGKHVEPLAVSIFGARPNGFVPGVMAERACEAATKRLCTLDEFVQACRGEDDTLFPYGDDYEAGLCNVNRDDHPAAILHGNASIGHLDPRLDRVAAKDGPLYQTTGQSPRCRSRWGTDAAYDLVGNLDEWVDHGGGAFAGGFYSRATKSGCEALVATHPKSYVDYSTGVRCCKDAAP